MANNNRKILINDSDDPTLAGDIPASEPSQDVGALRDKEKHIEPPSNTSNAASSLTFTDKPDEDSIKSVSKDTPVDQKVPKIDTPNNLNTESDKAKPIENKKELSVASIPATDTAVPEATDDKDEPEQAPNEPEVESKEDKVTVEPEKKYDDFDPHWRKNQKVPNRVHSKKRRVLWVLLVIIILIAVVVAYPLSRHWLLSKSQLKKNFELSFVDQTTQDPVSGLSVTLGSQTQKTDASGRADFLAVNLGVQKLVTNKPGYSPVNTSLSLEPWSKYSLPAEKLQVIGIRLQFHVQDLLSGQPIGLTKVQSEGTDASVDKQGQVTLVIPPTGKNEVSVKFSADGYKDQSVDISTTQTARQTIKLVPSQLDYFISNRDGHYGVYSSWLDGTHVQQLLPGSGQEDPKSMSLSIAPDNQTAILIATRDGIAQAGGYQQELFAFNLQTAQLTKLDQGNIRPIGWSGDWFVYTVVDPAKPYNDPQASSLKSVNYKTRKTVILSKTNYLVDLPQIVNSQIYYAPSDIYNSGRNNFFSSVSPDGSGGKQLITDKIVVAISRLSYTQLQLTLSDGSTLIYDTATGGTSSGGHVSASQIYSVNSDGQTYAWIEQRDGKSALLVHQDGKDKILYQMVGVSNPVHWAGNDILVFRMINDNGTTDYAISLNGGSPQAISDVSNVPD